MRRRAPIAYYGGKGNMVSKLLPLFPPHQVYCEAYGGGASLLFAKAPSPVEVYNDIDQRVVNLFRCLQDGDKFQALQHRLLHTPYARMEFVRAIESIKNGQVIDEVDAAWSLFVTHNQGFSGLSDKLSFGNWSRGFTSASGMSKQNNSWLMRLSMLPDWHKRLMMMQIDCNDALQVIRYWDRADTFFYLDPPYVKATRKGNSGYACEMTDDAHRNLIEMLPDVRGKVLLSAYNHPIYDVLDGAGWRKIIFQTACHAAGRTRNSGLQGDGNAIKKVPRTEVLWINYDPPGYVQSKPIQGRLDLEAEHV